MLDDKSFGICDEEGVQCLGGIMGGAAKGCCDETQKRFSECALFTPECIARTGRKFGIDSDPVIVMSAGLIRSRIFSVPTMQRR